MNAALDFSPLERLGLKLPAVGVKFDFFRPEGIPPLEKDKPMALCEMLRECQRRGAPFYFSREHQETCTGKVWLGSMVTSTMMVMMGVMHTCIGGIFV